MIKKARNYYHLTPITNNQEQLQSITNNKITKESIKTFREPECPYQVRVVVKDLNQIKLKKHQV